jgi:hypothetical protein
MLKASSPNQINNHGELEKISERVSEKDLASTNGKELLAIKND